jgi:4-carboxymuconolactone decarboxylase
MQYQNKYVVLAVLSLLIGFPGLVRSQPSPAWTPMTQEQFNASLPDDVYPDSRSRIPIVNRDELDDARKPNYDRYFSPNSTSLAGIQGPGGIGLHGSPDLSESKVDRRTQELARLVVSREMDQAFEWTLHEPVALREGVPQATIDIIRNRKPLDGVPERDASIIQLGRELFQDHKVSSATFALGPGHETSGQTRSGRSV